LRLTGKSCDSLNDSTHQEQKIQQMSNGLSDEENNQDDEPRSMVGNGTTFTTVKALLIKRFHMYKRDKTAIC